MTFALAIGQAFLPTAYSGEHTNVVIMFKGPVEPAVISAAGGTVTHTYSIIPAVAATIPQAAARGLSKHPAISCIEPDVEFAASAQSIPWGVSHIGAITVHSLGNKGARIKVGIVDTGIQTNHPDLRTYGGYNFVANTTNYNDDNGHGTHVAGTVACLDNDIGYIGVAPESYLYGVKVLSASGSGTLANIIKGIDWCRTNGMKAINMSLGASIGSNALQTACQNAYNAGIVLAAAAGGGGPSGGIAYPARYSSVIACVAVNSSNQAHSSSPQGPEIELSAPGVNIPSTWIGGGYMTLTGSSMAVPHVIGTAALVRYRYPTWSAAQVRGRMNSTAQDLGAVGWDPVYGWGLVRADRAAQ